MQISDDSPRLTYDFHRSKLSYKTFFIANNNFVQGNFLLCRENKAAEILSLFFSFISFNSHGTCGTHHSNFWFLSNSFNQIDIVRPMTPNLSANFSCDWIGFSLSDSSDSPLSNFFGLSKRSSSSKLKFPTLNLSYHFFYVL